MGYTTSWFLRDMMSPRYLKGGAGREIGYRLMASCLGQVLIAATEHGLCAVYMGDDDQALVDELSREYPLARRGPAPRESWARAVLAHIDGRSAAAVRATAGLPIDIRATPFQARVWRALIEVPPGTQRTYTDIAHLIGAPASSRAVGRACATNPVSVVIPCHRAMRKDGALAGFRWGLARKRALIDLESRLMRR